MIFLMHFVYIDDSGDGAVSCFSALIIPADQWRSSLDHLLNIRKVFRESDGIYVKSEMHATDWNAGKGKLSRRPISKQRRAELFGIFLSSVATVPGAQLINACVPMGQGDRAFERLLNRIQTNMRKSGSRAVVFCDEGKSYDAMRRRLGAYNYIPSRFGQWQPGEPARNITLDRHLEDIVYRDSKASAFVQAADACAYALLRRERPIPSKTALGLDKVFYRLEPIMVKAAYQADPYGVIR